jgi:hypothetical protein
MAVNARSISAGEALKVLDQGWTAQAEGGLQRQLDAPRPPRRRQDRACPDACRTQRGFELYDLRLTTIEPQDLRGLPFYDHETGRTVWYRPEDLPDDPDRPAILFLDELTAAAPTLQPTVYGLLQERRVGRHRLPDSVFIVAAGNMVEDGAIAYEMGTALSDRLIHMIVQADAEDWLKSYAPGAGIHPPSPPSSRTRPDLSGNDRGRAPPGPCHRLHAAQLDPGEPDHAGRPGPRRAQVMIAGTVGEAAAAEFALIADEIEASVQVAEMLEAPRRRPGGDVSRPRSTA